MKKKRNIALVLAFLLAGAIRLFAADNDVTMSQVDGTDNKFVTITPVTNGVIGFDGSDNLIGKTLTAIQTPWTQDILAGGFDLRNLSNLEFQITTAAPAGTVPGLSFDAGGINLNVPTGDLFDILVNNVTQVTINVSTIDFQGNTLTGVLDITSITSLNGVAIADYILATDNLGALAATTSAQFAGVISNETGTGLVVLADDPVFGDLTGDDITATGLLKLPTTTATVGQLQINGNRALHSFGGDTNIFVGKDAGNFTLSGATGNTGTGQNAGNALTSGDENTLIGRDAGLSLTTGGTNTAIGALALDAEQTGGNNTAIGANALGAQNGGTGNTGVGRAAGLNISTGENNTATGYLALAAETTGSQNAVVGQAALNASAGGNNNTSLGFESGFIVSTGDNNILLGFQAADNLTSGSANLIIGNDIDAQSPTASNQMSIGNAIFSEGIDGTGTTISTGGIGIGTPTPDTRLDVNGAITIQEIAEPGDPATDSSVTWHSDGTGFGDPGDYVIKINDAGSTKTITLVDFSAATDEDP